jgi:hypothetical protein
MNPALKQSGNSGRTRRRNSNRAKFGHGPIVPAHDDNFTLFHLIKVTREVGLGFLNVDVNHGLVRLYQ